jgi:hypothetical protein
MLQLACAAATPYPLCGCGGAAVVLLLPCSGADHAVPRVSTQAVNGQSALGLQFLISLLIR